MMNQRPLDSFDNVPADDGEVIRQHSRSFAFASRLLPPTVRKDVQRLYAWCRWCDDAVDSAASASEAQEQLAILRADVERIYRSEPPVHQASTWLAQLVAKYEIDRDYPLALLDGMEMDLELDQVATHRELIGYCYRAAGVVGLMMCRILGVKDRRALRHAESLGIAMQLTNIARDVREDWLRGRCYLPNSWLPKGIDDSTDDEIRSVVIRMLRLAEDYYRSGNEGMHFLPAAVRPAIRVAAAVYREIGIEIGRSGYQVMNGRITTPKLRFASAAAAAVTQGAIFDTRMRFGLSNTTHSKLDHPFPVPTELIMNDAKYLFYLGISLTAFMSSAAFLLVMLNPKDASYATLPVVYAAACFCIGIVTNLLAKRAESPVPVPVRSHSSQREQ